MAGQWAIGTLFGSDQQIGINDLTEMVDGSNPGGRPDATQPSRLKSMPPQQLWRQYRVHP